VNRFRSVSPQPAATMLNAREYFGEKRTRQNQTLESGFESIKITKTLARAAGAAAFLLAVCGIILPGPAAAIGMREGPGEQAYLDLANNLGPHRPGTAAPDFAAVAAIGVRDDLGFDLVGSGTLIAPQWVLTAAHVVLDPDRPARFVDGLLIRFGTDISLPSAEYRVTEIFTPRDQAGGYPAFAEQPAPGTTDADLIGAEFADIALIRLARPVSGIAPATMSPRPPQVGRRLLIAGYGEAAVGSQTDENQWRLPALRRAAENILDRDIAVEPFTGRRDRGGLLMFDFDDGSESRNSLNAITDAYWLAIAGYGTSDATPLPLEGSSYPGDSGGPAFAFLDAAWRIVGVSSGGSGWPVNGRRDGAVQYGDILLYTRVASHADWIRKTLLSR